MCNCHKQNEKHIVAWLRKEEEKRQLIFDLSCSVSLLDVIATKSKNIFDEYIFPDIKNIFSRKLRNPYFCHM